jgi:hypothetical protein
MPIEDQRRELSTRLAAAVGVEPDTVDRSILQEHEGHPPGRRNVVSVLASVAQLASLLESLTLAARRTWLDESVDGNGPNRDRILSGHIRNSTVRAAEEIAGPFDVFWDGNWPPEKARARLKGRIPSSKRPGDVIVGSDFGGTRIDILVTEMPDGILTGEPLSDTWRDPPFENVWIDTYKRLAAHYPDEVPH